MESYLPMFATDTRCLVSTERIRWDTVVHVVHLHHPTLYMTSETQKDLVTLREYIRTESILGIIGELYRPIYSVEGDDREDRPEYLLSPDSHIGSDIPEDHWCKKGSVKTRRNRELCEYSCSFCYSIAILLAYIGKLTLRYEWPNISGFFERISEFFRQELR